MKTITGLLLFLIVLLLSAPVGGQRHRDRPPQYDPSSEVTLEATVDQVTNHRCGRSWSGTHLVVTLDGKPIEVHLGPAVFIREQAITFSAGDKVKITGSRVITEDGEAIIARDVAKGEQLLVLRDADGRPQWPPQRWQW